MNRLPFYVILALFCTSLAFPISFFQSDGTLYKTSTENGVSTTITLNSYAIMDQSGTTHFFVYNSTNRRGEDVAAGMNLNNLDFSFDRNVLRGGLQYYSVQKTRVDDVWYVDENRTRQIQVNITLNETRFEDEAYVEHVRHEEHGYSYSLSSVANFGVLRSGFTSPYAFSFKVPNNQRGNFNITFDNGVFSDPTLSGCAQINESGEYLLDTDIVGQATTCFNITAENITLDMQGHDVNGSNTENTYGLYTNQFNSTVKNGIIRKFSTGIYFNGATGGTILNTTAQTTLSTGIGISLISSSQNEIINSTGTSSTVHGIYLSSSNSNNITNSNSTTASGESWATYLLTSSNNIIAGGRHIGASRGIYLLTNSNYNIIENTTTTGTSQSMLIREGSSWNNISHNNITGSVAAEGLFLLTQASNNFLLNNTAVTVSGLAISVQVNSNNNQLINNTAKSNSNTALSIEANSSYNILTGNLANGSSGSGFGLSDSHKNNFSNNRATTQSGHGIFLNLHSENNTFTSNTFNTTSGIGILITEGSFNTFVNNSGNSTSANGLQCTAGRHNTFTNSSYSSNTASGILLGCNNTILTRVFTNSSSMNAINITAQAENVSIDLQGLVLNGTNSSNTYGIYSKALNTTVKNGIIDRYQTGIWFDSANSGLVLNMTALTSATSGYGFYLSSNSNNQIINSTGTSSSSFGLFSLNSNSNNITGGFISSSTGQSAINITGSNSSIFRNITINSSKTCINISSTSENNSFFYNYLYNCTTYIENYNSNNTFNTTSGSVAQGNYYQNILGLPIYDSNADNYGDTGAGYPYSAATVGGNWTGLGADWGPIGAQNTSVSITITAPSEGQNISTGKKFNATWTVVNSSGNTHTGYVSCGNAPFTINFTTLALIQEINLTKNLNCSLKIQLNSSSFYLNSSPVNFSRINSIPNITFTTPANGQIFYAIFLNRLNYSWTATDADEEDFLNFTGFANTSVTINYRQCTNRTAFPFTANLTCPMFNFGAGNYIGYVFVNDGTTVVSSEINYFSVQEKNVGMLAGGALIALAFFTFIFAYLHTHAIGAMWSKLWYLFCCLFVIAEILTILAFAIEEGNASITGIAQGLFVGFIWVFIISLWMFFLELLLYCIRAVKGQWEK